MAHATRFSRSYSPSCLQKEHLFHLLPLFDDWLMIWLCTVGCAARTSRIIDLTGAARSRSIPLGLPFFLKCRPIEGRDIPADAGAACIAANESRTYWSHHKLHSQRRGCALLS